MKFDFDTLQEEDSPYPEVRASVSNIDDPDTPALTIRVWIVGLFLSLAGGYVSFLLSRFPSSLTVFADRSGLNVFFNFRQPAPLVIPIVLLLVAHPLGKFLSYSLPTSPSAYALQEVSGPRRASFPCYD
jgi:hypothetical protein